MSERLFCLPLTASGLLTKLPYLLTNYPDFVKVKAEESTEAIPLISMVQAPFWTVTGAEQAMFWACEPNSATIIFLRIKSLDGKMVTEWLRRKGGGWEAHPTYPELEIVLGVSDSNSHTINPTVVAV